LRIPFGNYTSKTRKGKAKKMQKAMIEKNEDEGMPSARRVFTTKRKSI